MKQTTREWVRKAENDFKVASQIVRRRKDLVADAACFFSQQCVEKYLKARLTEAGVAFPRTHELSILLQLCVPVEPRWSVFDQGLAAMSQFGVLVRYPGTWATLT